MSRTLILLGAIGMMVAVLMSAETVGSYLRHMDSQDQAGAALGMLFVIGYVAPVAAALLTIGAVPIRIREWRAGRALKSERWTSGLLMIIGGLMAVFTVLFMVPYMHSLLAVMKSGAPLQVSGVMGYGTYAAALLVLVCNIVGMAVALRAGPRLVENGGLGWLGPLMAVLAPIPFLSFLALLFAGVPSAGVLWAAALAWSALALRSTNGAAPQGGTR